MESSTYPDRKLIEASRNFVNVVCHKETGHDREIVFNGKKVKWCSRYWGISCEAHSSCFKQAGNQYEGIRGVPCTILADPAGKELWRKAGGMSASELIKAMEETLKQVPGEKIHYDLWAAAKKHLADGDAAFDKQEFKKAVEAYSKAAKMKQKGLKTLGEEALKKANDKGGELVEEAKGKLESEKDEAKKLLRKIADDFKPLECSKKAAEVLKSLEEKK